MPPPTVHKKQYTCKACDVQWVSEDPACWVCGEIILPAAQPHNAQATSPQRAVNVGHIFRRNFGL